MVFRDRVDAGRQLAERLVSIPLDRPVILGLPRGGVPVGAEVARALAAPLDVILVRKLGVPGHRELAMGAIGEGDVRVVDAGVVRAARVSAHDLARVEAHERLELEARAARYRADRPRVALTGRDALIVDDGFATGSTARAAIAVARAAGASRVILAAPVAPPDTVRALMSVADVVVVVDEPTRMHAIGTWYRDFSQTSDREVQRLLRDASA